MSKKIKVFFIVVMFILLSFLNGCEENHNDGKCDVCGKTATYTDSEEEYCEKHLTKAIEWYLEQD